MGNSITAQEWYNAIQEPGHRNYLSLEETFLSDSTAHVRGKEKEYLKWSRTSANELDEQGFILPEEIRFKKVLAIQKEKSKAKFNPNWEPFAENKIAPKGFKVKANKGLARLNRIYVSQKNRQTIYAATSLAGLWKSEDNGITWNDLTTSKIPVTSVWAVAEHPKNPKLIILGDRYTMYRSKNAGKTWEQVTDTTLLVRDIYFDAEDPKKVYAASEKGIYKSVDSGKTWNKILEIKANAMRVHPSNPNILYATEIVDNDVKIWVTEDAGKSFSEHTLPEYEGRKVGRTRLDVSRAAPDKVFLVTNNTDSRGFGALYVSHNRGKDWKFASNKVDGKPYGVENPNVLGYSEKGDKPGGQINYCFAFGVSQTNADEMYVAGISMWKSKDGGKTWQNHSPWYATDENLNHHLHADIHDIYAEGKRVWVAHDGGISFSGDGSKTFADRTGGINALEILGFDINFHRPEEMVNASMHVGSMFYEPNAKGWYSTGGADDNYCGFGINSTKHFIHGAGYIHNLAHWENGLEAMDNIAVLPHKEPNGALGIHTQNHQVFFQGLIKYNGTVDNNGSTLYRSLDFGKTWHLVLKDDLHSDDGRGHNARGYASKSKVVSCWNNTDHLYYKNGGRIYESMDMGQNWKIVHDFNTTDNEEWQKSRIYKSRLLDIIVDPQNDNTLYVTMRNMFDSKTVLKSTDAGRTWEDFSQGIPEEAGRVNSIVMQRGTNKSMYVGTYRGVYYRDNTMDKWEPYHNGLPVCDVVKVKLDYKNHKLVVGTFGRGIWKADLMEKSNPDLRIAYNKTVLDQGESLKLVDYSVYPFVPTKYEWKVEGTEAFTSNEKHPEIELQKKGDYKVSLFAWDDNGKEWSTVLGKMIMVR